MKMAALLFVGYIGYRLGKSGLRVHRALALVTILVAAILHLSIRLMLPHDTIEGIAMATAWSWWSAILVAVAAVETAGIWLPILLIHWAESRTRVTAAAYVVGAATIGALVYYQPFDVVIVNGQREGPTHPEYEAALVLSLIFAIVPFAIGFLARRRHRKNPTETRHRDPITRPDS